MSDDRVTLDEMGQRIDAAMSAEVARALAAAGGSYAAVIEQTIAQTTALAAMTKLAHEATRRDMLERARRSGESLAAEFDEKARTNSWLTRWWYRRAATSLRRDLERLKAT